MVAIVTLIGSAAVILVWYFSLTKCNSCEKRGTVKWLNSTKSGGRDMRYKENYMLCSSCGNRQ